jgi:hypothetical protein
MLSRPDPNIGSPCLPPVMKHNWRTKKEFKVFVVYTAKFGKERIEGKFGGKFHGHNSAETSPLIDGTFALPL